MPADSFTSLTPLSFLARAADVFSDKTAIAYGDRRTSYSELAAEATRLAHALRAAGVQRGDRVAYMCPNIPEMLVANFGVPLAVALTVLPALSLHGLVTAALAIVVFVAWWLLLALLAWLRRT